MRPIREQFRSNRSAYFVSTQTIGRRVLFQTDRWATLLNSVLEHYDGDSYILHAWVIMPDHLHVLLTSNESLEKSVQLIKGGFSFRVKRELVWNGEVWQPGFTDHRIRDHEDWTHHLAYIRQNPVEARLAVDYPWMGFPNIDFPQGLKHFPERCKPKPFCGLDFSSRKIHPHELRKVYSIPENALKPRIAGALDVRAEARTLQAQAGFNQAETTFIQAEGRTVLTREVFIPGEAGTYQAESTVEERVKDVAKTAPFQSKSHEVISDHDNEMPSLK